MARTVQQPLPSTPPPQLIAEAAPRPPLTAEAAPQHPQRPAGAAGAARALLQNSSTPLPYMVKYFDMPILLVSLLSMVGMSLTSCLFRRRHPAKKSIVKKIPLFNKNMIYLIDENFWNLGFKNETQAEKVIICIIRVIYVIFFLRIILIMSIMSQVHVDLGIADHVWQERGTAIAGTIDALGNRFKSELRTGWLAYIHETYSDGPDASAATTGE